MKKLLGVLFFSVLITAQQENKSHFDELLKPVKAGRTPLHAYLRCAIFEGKESKYYDFLRQNGFEKPEIEITSQDMEKIFYSDGSAWDKATMKIQADLANRCQQKPLHDKNCDALMLTFERNARYSFWKSSETRKKLAQVVAIFKKNKTEADAIASVSELPVIGQLNWPREVLYQTAPWTRVDDDSSLFCHEDILYDQLMACTDESKNKKKCINGLKDLEKIKKVFRKRDIYEKEKDLCNLDKLSTYYMKHNVHNITQKDLE